MIHVLALITAHPGQRDALLAIFRANVPNVHAEQGCIEYRPVTDAEGFGKFAAPLGPDTFAVIEKWESAEALRAHAAAPHMADYAARSKPLIASRVIHVLADA